MGRGITGVIATVVGVVCAASLEADDKLAPARDYVDHIRLPDLPGVSTANKPDPSGQLAASYKPAPRGFKITEPPPPTVPPSIRHLDGYDIAIARHASDADRRIKRGEAKVLVLGMFSDASSVVEATALRDPKDGKPYDVIIGVGSNAQSPAKKVWNEVERVVLRDHFDAQANVAALKTALSEEFHQQSIDASVIDVHSNGTAVGVTAIESGVFGKVDRMNIMGPDVGFAEQYVDPARLEKLARAHGMQSIDIHEIRGDVVQALPTAAHAAAQALIANGKLDLASRSPDSPIKVHYYAQDPLVHDPEGSLIGDYIANTHFITKYVEKRSLAEIRDAYQLGDKDAKAVWDQLRPEQRAMLLEMAAKEPREGPHLAAKVEPQVGGVLLRFELDKIDALDEIRVFTQLATRTQKTPFVVQAAPKEAHVVAVSLRKLLDEHTTTLGALTRVRGYAVNGDDILLIGEVQPGAAPIPLELLGAATKAVWKAGLFPYVSLDPDPAQFAGPQRVRIGGVPDELRDSELVRIMLDADYAMKRIGLGEDKLVIPGFESQFDLYLGQPPPTETMTRFWLTPVQSGAAEMLASASSDKPAVLFESRVQVLTEAVRRAGDYLEGTGDVDAMAERAARSFSDHYDEIASQRPVFKQLANVFAVAKLAAVWRARGVAHPILDRLAVLPVPHVPVPARYDGIGPKAIGATGFVIAGGAQLRSRVTPAMFSEVGSLRDLATIADGEQRTVKLPASLDIDAQRGQVITAELSTRRGIERWKQLDYAGAEVELSTSIAEDPEAVEARVYRALSRFALGKVEDAIKDIDVAVPRMPSLRALRGMLHAALGHSAEALADADAAATAFPDDDAVLLWAATAHLFADDPAGAETLLLRLHERAPLDAGGNDLRAFIDFLFQLGPSAAAERIALLRRLPVPLSHLVMRATERLRRFDFDDAEQQFAACVKLAEAGDRASLGPLYIREHCTFGLALALDAHAKAVASIDPEQSAKLQAAATQLSDQLIAMHPDWPTAAFLAARDPARSDATKLFHAAKDAKTDPLLADLTAVLGTDSPRPYLGIALWYRFRDIHPGEAGPILRETIPMLKSPAREIWTALEKIERQTPPEALTTLRSAESALPASIPGDALTQWSLGYFYEVYIEVEHEAGDTARAKEAVARYLARTRDLDAGPTEILTQVAAFRLDIESALLEARDKPTVNRGEDELVALYLGKAQAAASPMEVRTIALQLDILRVAAEAPQVRAADPAVSDGLRRVLAAVDPVVEVKRLVPRPAIAHDWKHWHDRQPDPVAAPSRHRRSLLANLGIAALVGGSVALLAVAVRRRKRRAL